MHPCSSLASCDACCQRNPHRRLQGIHHGFLWVGILFCFALLPLCSGFVSAQVQNWLYDRRKRKAAAARKHKLRTPSDVQLEAPDAAADTGNLKKVQ